MVTGLSRWVPLVLSGLATGTLLLAVGCSPAATPTATPTRATTPVATPTTAATAVVTPTTAPTAVATPTRTPTLAPSPTPTSAQPKTGGILTVAQRGDPAGWDPMATNIVTAVGLTHGLYGESNLVQSCREDIYKLCPVLAEKWESSSDFTQWTFTIRSNALWHDGKPFTAQDAKWWADASINGVKDRKPSIFKSTFGPVKTVEALDGNRLRITLTSPRPTYLESIGELGNQIAHPPHLMQPEIDKGNFTVAPNEVGYVATGPFKYLKYEKGSILQVRRFDKYWEKDKAGRQLPYLDGVDYPIIKDSTSVLAAFRTGRIDATAKGSGFHLTPEDKATIEKEMGSKAYFISMPYLAWSLTPNARREPWNDVRVRKALSLWIDRDAGIKSVHGGFAELSTFWAPTSPWVNPDFRTWPGYNPATKEKDRAEAKKLLAEAGYANGFKTTIMCRDLWVAWCEFHQAQLAGLLGAGNVKIEVVDTATRGGRITRGDFDIHPDSHSAIFPSQSPSDFLTTNTVADVKHDDKKVDEYFDRLTATASYEDRVKLAREVERYILQEQYLTTYLWYETAVLAYRSHVKGVPVPGQLVYLLADYATTWIDK